MEREKKVKMVEKYLKRCKNTSFHIDKKSRGELIKILKKRLTCGELYDEDRFYIAGETGLKHLDDETVLEYFFSTMSEIEKEKYSKYI